MTSHKINVIFSHQIGILLCNRKTVKKKKLEWMEHQNAIVSIIIRVNYSFLHNVDFSKTKKSASQINRGIYRGENEKMAAHSRTDE